MYVRTYCVTMVTVVTVIATVQQLHPMKQEVQSADKVRMGAGVCCQFQFHSNTFSMQNYGSVYNCTRPVK